MMIIIVGMNKVIAYMVDSSYSRSLTSTPTTDEFSDCIFKIPFTESTNSSPYSVNITGVMSNNSYSTSDN